MSEFSTSSPQDAPRPDPLNNAGVPRREPFSPSPRDETGEAWGPGAGVPRPNSPATGFPSQGLPRPTPLPEHFDDQGSDELQEDDEPPLKSIPLASPRRGRKLVKKDEPKDPVTPQQRLLLLDTWQRSGLPAAEFASLVGVSKHTLYEWKRRFEAFGPAGLLDKPKGAPQGSRLPELTRRTILMLKKTNPSWGCPKISDALLRGPALPASPAAVARVLHEAGYELEESPTRPHEPPVRSVCMPRASASI
jgi:transposase